MNFPINYLCGSRKVFNMNQTFINCNFEYECPKNWFELESTNKSGVKHCKECKKDVHLCINQEELDYAITQNHCIAYFQDPGLQIRFKLSREKCEANQADVNFVPEVILGLPKNSCHPQRSAVDILLGSSDDPPKLNN